MMFIVKVFLTLNILFIMIHGHSSYYYQNPSNNFHSIISSSKSTGPNCQNMYLCHLIRGINYKSIDNMPHFVSTSSPQEYRRQTFKTTAVQPRSYYGYGANAAPAYYPLLESINPVRTMIFRTFDPISILASLAFLAFLLQSFVSLFDRSRSIIPAVVSSRDSTSQHRIPDPIQLIMRAIDEYAVSNHSMKLLDQEDCQKKLS